MVTVIACLLGFASVSADRQAIDSLTALITVVLALFVHAAANVINDYYDARSGCDEANQGRIFPFTGGSRMIQNGVLSMRATANLGFGLLAAVVVPGVWLVLHGAPWLVPIGLCGLLIAWAYSAPPLSLQARGLGEVAVAVAWLLVVVGSDYALRRTLAIRPWAAGLAYALLVANVLYINQFPDRLADAFADKRTLVVRLGAAKARWGYLLLMLLAALWLGAMVYVGILPVASLLALCPLLVAGVAFSRLWRLAAVIGQGDGATAADCRHVQHFTIAIRLTLLAAIGHGLLLALILVRDR